MEWNPVPEFLTVDDFDNHFKLHSYAHNKAEKGCYIMFFFHAGSSLCILLLLTLANVMVFCILLRVMVYFNCFVQHELKKGPRGLELRRSRYIKKKNGCHLENTGNIDLIFHVHILGDENFYGLSEIKALARRLETPMTMLDNDNGQFMITQALWRLRKMSQTRRNENQEKKNVSD